MNQTHKAIILMIKSAILQQPQSLPEGFSLDQVMGLIRKHHMAALIYDGALRCGYSPAEQSMQQLFRLYYGALLKSEGQQGAIRRICNAFSREGIDYMLLKGSRMKDLYPKPELRYMGDADILIREEQYGQIQPVMKSLGFVFRGETEHELLWRSDDLTAELHKCLIPARNRDLYEYYGDGWKLALPMGEHAHCMKAEDEWVYLFTHFAKHYRSGGVGCRYVADLWVWRRAHPDMDEAYIRRALCAMQLEDFHAHILRLLDYWFADGPEDETLDIITEFIFSSGSWGVDEVRVLSQAVRNIKYSTTGSSGRLLYLRKTVFPDVQTLRYSYKVLYKAPWLLPVVWVIRIVEKVFFDRKKWKNQGRRLDVLTRENIRLRQEMLNLVGLDYHQ